MLWPSWTLGTVGMCPRGVITTHSTASAGDPAIHPSSHFGIWSPLRPPILPSYKFPDSFEINTVLNQHIGCHCTHFIIYVTQSSKTPVVLHNHRPMCVLYNQLEFHFAIVTPGDQTKAQCLHTPASHYENNNKESQSQNESCSQLCSFYP